MPLNKPVLFVIFNRPNVTKRVFEQIREAKPYRLYIAADGPRKDRKEDETLCTETRNIVDNIDWECEIFKKYSHENIGMKISVPSAINWFFENEEEGIILEDDVLPSQSFFSFCSKMLDYYKFDNRIMHVSGCNLQFGNVYGDGTYYFSHLSNIWGWATWKRAWKYYDLKVEKYPIFLANKHFDDILIGDSNKWQFKWIMNSIYKGRDTWDFQWAFTVLSQSGLCITPNINLISNLGYGNNSTTSFYTKTKLASLQKGELFELKHPTFIIASAKADYFFNKITFNQIPLIIRAYNKLIKTISEKIK